MALQRKFSALPDGLIPDTLLQSQPIDGMIFMQHNSEEPTKIMVEPDAGKCTDLCCNKRGKHSPALGFNPNSPDIPDEALVDFLASILVEGFVELASYELRQEKGGNLLPRINKGTS